MGCIAVEYQASFMERGQRAVSQKEQELLDEASTWSPCGHHVVATTVVATIQLLTVTYLCLVHLLPWQVAYLRKAGEAKERRVQDLQAMGKAKLQMTFSGT